jgi:hypothetical protein
MNVGATRNGRRITGFLTDMDGQVKRYIQEDGTFTSFMAPQSKATTRYARAGCQLRPARDD